jgi:hypothetical protein
VPALVRHILVIVAVGLLLGACGDDDDDATPAAQGEGTHGGDADAYVEAVGGSLNEAVASLNESGEGVPLDQTQTRCVARAIVDVVGVDALREAGISPDEFAGADDLPRSASSYLTTQLLTWVSRSANAISSKRSKAWSSLGSPTSSASSYHPTLSDAWSTTWTTMPLRKPLLPRSSKVPVSTSRFWSHRPWVRVLPW